MIGLVFCNYTIWKIETGYQLSHLIEFVEKLLKLSIIKYNNARIGRELDLAFLENLILDNNMRFVDKSHLINGNMFNIQFF